MPIAVRKKDNETTQSAVYRFTKAVRNSGLLFSLRSKRFRHRPKSRLSARRSAIRREQIKKQRQLEEKLGKQTK